MIESPDIVVIGAGILGLACARQLYLQGARVEVWERATVAAGASGKSAGMLAPLAEVPDDPAFFRICREARDLWTRWAPELESETGFDLDYDRSGALILDEGGNVERLRLAAERSGEPWRLLDSQEARRWVPDLSPSSAPILRLDGEHRVDNTRVCTALSRALTSSGVVIRTGREVWEIRLRGASRLTPVRLRGTDATGTPFELETGAVVVAAGAWSGQIVGLPTLPVRPVRGQMFRLEGVEWPFLGCVRSAQHYAVRRRGGQLVVGATVEEAAFDDSTTTAGLDELRAFLRLHLPGCSAHSETETWAGLRPGSPDDRPILGQVEGSEGRVWLATGHYRNGILLAPWSAHYLADAMLGSGSTELADGDLFSPKRFGIGYL